MILLFGHWPGKEAKEEWKISFGQKLVFLVEFNRPNSMV